MQTSTLYLTELVDNDSGDRKTAQKIIQGSKNGWFDYNDLATSITPLVVLAEQFTKIPNDTLGPFTNLAFKPEGITSLWNPVTSQFEWNYLEFGDMVDIRVDLEVTTESPNQTVELELVLGIGSGGEYSIPFANETEKNAGALDLNRFNGIYMGDPTTKNYPSEFRIKSDSNLTVKTRGFYIRVIKKS